MPLTQGQKLALEQLDEVAALSNDELEPLGEPEELDKGSIRLTLSLRTRPFRTGRGMAFRDRERLWLYIPAEFPFARPSLWFAHVRFKGEPHVQWGTYICLYQAPEAEWLPADGMYGFFERVHDWFVAAGANELDPDDAPLHPPVAYATRPLTIVARADAPEVGDEPWVGRADMREIGDQRLDLVGWTALAEWMHDPRPTSDAFALLLPRPLPMEFPTKVWDLTVALRDAGVPLERLLPALHRMAVATPASRSAIMIVGAPMRRRAAGEPIRQHLTAWRLKPEQVDVLRAYALEGTDLARDAVVDWMLGASVEWCTVLEDRVEIVNRRDQASPASWLRGRRVLLLGCGALGSVTAELVVRAGASALSLVDNGRVEPGILVRQRYADSDIGNPKSDALKDRLLGLGLGCAVEARCANLARNPAWGGDAGEAWDLVIDATASQSVAHRLERDLKTSGAPCPIVRMEVSAGARHGSVTVRMSGSPHGPVGLTRMAKLVALSGGSRHPLVDSFWPAEPPALLQPEPGCTEPTFSGSAADIDHQAAGLLNLGLTRLGALGPDEASMDLVAAPWVEMPPRCAQRLGYVLPSWRRIEEKVHGYDGFLSPKAWRGIETEMRRIARVRSDRVETGGLMLGEVDEAHRTIWIDAVTGPPPDSEASEERFVCGVEGTRETVGRAMAASGGSSRFVGIWHTHPLSVGRPSEEDMHGMFQLLRLQERPPRRTAMLIVGHSATAPSPAFFLFRRQDLHVKFVRAEAAS